MPSLFKKLFRRNGKSSSSDKPKTAPSTASAPIKSKSKTAPATIAPPPTKEATVKRTSTNQKGTNSNHSKKTSQSKTEEEQSPSLTTSSSTWRSAPSIQSPTTKSNKTSQKSASSRVLSPRNNQPIHSGSKHRGKRSPGPVDLDELEESDENRNETQILSKKRLEQFNMQHPPQQTPPSLYTLKDTPISPKPGPGDQSESSASEFNLSTDAEDEEYNNMRKQYQASDSSALDTSATGGMPSPTDDQDNTVFPELRDINPAEDNHTTSSASKLSKEDDMRAWGLSPQGSTKENLTEAARRQPQQRRQPEDFNFANFDNAFPDPNPFGSVGSPTPSQTKSESRIIVDAHDLIGSSATRKRNTSSASAAVVDTSLSDLLAQAKKASSRRNGSKPSSSSVNSAPAVTSNYLRHHGIRADGTSSDYNKTTSVSDIIQSLEATNAARLSSSSRRSVGSRDSAKERIRERRRRRQMMEQEASSGEDEQDSWLFDEVTGALGPRGVAADMESLGGRSNNSKRSHRSRRSRRSKNHKNSSNESVDSRNSRNSRYSHRSTRSYLSHMSQESRSVANDLLRLEMQLAMVGSTENGSTTNESGPATTTSSSKHTSNGSVSGSINSRTSRSSRRTASLAKRSKIAVVAPPGKLGIILANKADSKGTVVSGVRTSSVLAEKISPGDRIVAIDGEDCSRMTVSEITTIMARKADFERILTVLTTHKRSSGGDVEKSKSKSSSSYRHPSR